jgi:hypothetical protein
VLAGAIYSCLVLAAGMLVGAASQRWLVPLAGEAASFAAELTVMLPFAWKSSAVVTRRFGVTSALPAGLIAAGTAALLVSSADFGLLTVLEPGLGKPLLNQGWIEARFVGQMLMAAFPLIRRYG